MSEKILFERQCKWCHHIGIMDITDEIVQAKQDFWNKIKKEIITTPLGKQIIEKETKGGGGDE